MSEGATSAVRDWVNARTDLVGVGNPLPLGAFLKPQASPGDGAYAVLAALPGTPAPPVAEGTDLTSVRVGASVYAGTEEAAELAAEAYADAVRSLTGAPAPAGPGWVILVSDGVQGPAFQPPAADSGEAYSFFVQADLILRELS